MGDGFPSLLEGMGRVKCPTLVCGELLASQLSCDGSCSSLIPRPCSLGNNPAFSSKLKITIWCCVAGVGCDVRHFVSSGTTERTSKPAHSVWYVGGGKGKEVSTRWDLDCAVLYLPPFAHSPFSLFLFLFLVSPPLPSSFPFLPLPCLPSPLPSLPSPLPSLPSLPSSFPPFTGNTKTAFYELNSVYGHDTFMLDLNNVGAAVKVSN